MKKLEDAYKACFKDSEPAYHIFSPYCVCPLGAHVDHQHGLVTGFALDRGIDILFSPTEDGQVVMVSTLFGGQITLNVRETTHKIDYNWGDYLRGALWVIQQKYKLHQGLQGVVIGSMPSGGIASSAALLCGFVAALAHVNGLVLSQEEIVSIAFRAEHHYIGLNNGILDQSCVTLCKKNQLLFLDTETSEHRLIPFGDDDAEEREVPFKIAIFYSGVTRSLTNTDYNLRVEECRTAASILQAYEEQTPGTDDHLLRHTSQQVFERYATSMPPRFARRARHFFTECDRVREGINAWQEGDIEQFGELIFESCESSILNYESGSPQLIALYRILRSTPGVYGARFCGAGFIGSCFALIDPDEEGAIRERLASEYLQQFPMYGDAIRSFICESHGGLEWL